MTDGKTEESEHRIVATQTAHAGWTRLLLATLRLADGRTIRREIEDHGEAACVLPYHPGRKTAILVRQLRVPILFAANAQETLEAIAGVIEDEDAAACARREAKEEAQLELHSVEHLFTAWTMPGLSTERMHFYLARYAGEARDEVRGGIAGDHEETIAVEIGLAELARMADGNELADVKTLLLLQTLRLRQPHLFVSGA
ncbi:MAG TPA: NUDIX hydrolase [Xanthobacteraceae bacterium]|nr:NUDIX hydrolase [Xanthobacteraceae bacterium]